MVLRFHPYTLALKHTFTVSAHSRDSTPVMFVEVEHDGVIGYGEASMPPYLGESQDTAGEFLSRVDLGRFDGHDSLDDVVHYVDGIAPGNHAAKAAVDIALHDWLGKIRGNAWYRIWGLDLSNTPPTSFTIGIDSAPGIRQRVQEAAQYTVLKVKLGRDNDREIIRTIREVTDKPIRVDVNQGWQGKEQALESIEWLATMNVELVEQPLPKQNVDEQVWLKERSPIPVFADEAVQRLPDLSRIAGVYDGVNIKLMKCAGMHEARRMIEHAHGAGLKVMLGCMTETSCAISAAAQLAPLADYADLDGALLVANDPFRGATVVDGKVIPTGDPGIGVTKVNDP